MLKKIIKISLIVLEIAIGVPVLALVVYLIYAFATELMESIPLFLFFLSVIGLLLGMLWPSLIMWWGGKKMRTRKMALIIFGSMAAIFLFWFGITYVLPIYNFQEKISEIEYKYNINLEYKNPPRPAYAKTNVTALSEKDEAELARYIKIFYEEINKYPQDFIKNIDLREVVFVKNISVTQKLNEKTVTHYRAAYPDYPNEVLFYDIYYGKFYKPYEREIIHHELYHMVEEEINGSSYYKDPIWASFNDPKFKYKSGGAQAYEDKLDISSKPPKGFISTYSTYGLEEDKAEIFANLMIPKLSKKLYSLAAHDPILAKKMEYMKKFLSKHSKYMNEYFWQNIRNCKSNKC